WSAVQIRNFPDLLAQKFSGGRIPLRLGDDIAGEGRARPDAVIHRGRARVVDGVDAGPAAIAEVAVQLRRGRHVPGDHLALALHEVLTGEHEEGLVAAVVNLGNVNGAADVEIRLIEMEAVAGLLEPGGLHEAPVLHGPFAEEGASA